MSSAAVCLMWWSRREVVLKNEQHLRDDREKVPKRGREEGGVDGRSSKQDLYRFHTSCKPTSSLHVPYNSRHIVVVAISSLLSLWDNAPGRTLLSSPLSHITTKSPFPSTQKPKPTNPPSSTIRRWASPVPKISNPYSKPKHKSSPRIQLFPP